MCECICACLHKYTQRFTNRNAFVGTSSLSRSWGSKQPLNSAPTCGPSHPHPLLTPAPWVLLKPKRRAAAYPLFRTFWGLTAWNGCLLQSLLASVLSPFMLLRECPLTFQDPVKTHVLYKTFPNQSIQLPSQQAEVTPCHIFQKHCDPMLRLLSTGRKAPVSRMPANCLCMPSFSPKHLVYNNTHQMFDDLTNASFSWHRIPGIKDTFKRKVWTQGTLPLQGKCAVGGACCVIQRTQGCASQGALCESQTCRGRTSSSKK